MIINLFGVISVPVAYNIVKKIAYRIPPSIFAKIPYIQKFNNKKSSYKFFVTFIDVFLATKFSHYLSYKLNFFGKAIGAAIEYYLPISVLYINKFLKILPFERLEIYLVMPFINGFNKLLTLVLSEENAYLIKSFIELVFTQFLKFIHTGNELMNNLYDALIHINIDKIAEWLDEPSDINIEIYFHVILKELEVLYNSIIKWLEVLSDSIAEWLDEPSDINIEIYFHVILKELEVLYNPIIKWLGALSDSIAEWVKESFDINIEIYFHVILKQLEALSDSIVEWLKEPSSFDLGIYVKHAYEEFIKITDYKLLNYFFTQFMQSPIVEKYIEVWQEPSDIDLQYIFNSDISDLIKLFRKIDSIDIRLNVLDIISSDVFKVGLTSYLKLIFEKQITNKYANIMLVSVAPSLISSIIQEKLKNYFSEDLKVNSYKDSAISSPDGENYCHSPLILNLEKNEYYED